MSWKEMVKKYLSDKIMTSFLHRHLDFHLIIKLTANKYTEHTAVS